ncbi:MAG: HD domain-containing protein [Candidatus Caldarchaeum sp.]
MSSYKVFFKEVRDPLYGYIHLTPLEARLIDTKIFQRLGRLLQNPGTSFVYPNATHTRKAHSLGVMHLAGIAIKKLLMRQCSKLKQGGLLFREPVTLKVNKQGEIDEEEGLDDLASIKCDWWDGNIEKDPDFIIEVVRVAALMHDLGHGPFSHIFEDAVREKCDPNFSHEHMSVKLLENIKSYVTHEIEWNKKEENIVEYASYILKKDKNKVPQFLIDLIDGPVDVDKLDYVNRDAYHAGPLEYGLIDYERVLDGFRVSGKKLVYSASSIGAIARVFDSLEYMYSNLYYHKTARAADLQIFEALKESKNLLKQIINDMNEYIKWTDELLLREIEAQGSQAAIILVEELLARQLKYKKKAEKIVGFTYLQAPYIDVGKKIEDLETKFNDVGARVDTFMVKPMRLDLERLLNWLKGDNLISDGQLKNIAAVDRTLSDRINNFKLVVRLYVNRKKYADPRAEKAAQEFKETFR